MNANELADVFDTYEEPHDWGTQAQAMLRQQQAEIEALKQSKFDGNNKVKKLTDEEYKPLTEADVPYQKSVSKEITDEIGKALGLKTLTDEEIDMLVHEYNCIDDYPHEFVRACIRKAQEK